MKEEFSKIWSEFTAFSSPHLQSLHFYSQQSKFALALCARINTLCEEIFILASHDCFVSSQILLRSTLESYVDLLNVLSDESYVDCILAADADSEHKYLSGYSSENAYYRASEPPSEKRLDVLKSEKSQGLKISKRFQKAGCMDLYLTVYNNLCRHSHGNVSALASKHFENDRVVLRRKVSDPELLFIMSSAIKIAISSTSGIFEFFDIPDSERDRCEGIRDQVAVLCKDYV